jgi:ADP-heptose:LPS heptosyltransferase
MPWAERKNKWSAFVKNILPLWALILELRKEKFSIVIDARGDIRAQAFLVLTGCPVRVGCTQYVNSNISFRGLLLTNKAGYVPSLSKVQYNLHVLKEGLGCNVEGAKLRLIYEKPGSVKNEFRIVCHPGAGWKYRLWPEERWSDLVNRILLRYSVHITFVGGPGEETLLNSIKKISNEKVSFKVTTLEQLLETISSSDLFIGLDSGPMHIATALDKSIIALFGPGNLTIWRPESEKAKVITHADKFECAPCVQNSCIHPDNPCMKAITTDEVFEVVESVLTVKLQK